MGLLGVFGITNDGLNLAANLLLLFLAVVWLALVYWTYADARRRIADPMVVGCATTASLFPFVGTVVYLIVRPPEYLEDVHERALEIAAAEARLAAAEHHSCPFCGYEVERAFLRCPSCLRRLKEPCATCGKPLDPRWTICPYCEAEVGQPAPAPVRRERRERRRERAPASAPGAQPQPAASQPGPAQPAQRKAPQPGQRAASRPSDRAPAARSARTGVDGQPARQAHPADGTAERPAQRRPRAQ